MPGPVRIAKSGSFRDLTAPDGPKTRRRVRRNAPRTWTARDAVAWSRKRTRPPLNARAAASLRHGQTIDRRGEVTGDPPAALSLSYWISGFCSPFVTFGERIATSLEAREIGDANGIQTAVNGGFGELYQPAFGKVPPWQEVGELKGQYSKGDLPDGVVHLVTTVDVQKNRLIYLTRGWGARATSWLLDWGEFHGETTHPEVWAVLGGLPFEQCLRSPAAHGAD